MGQLRAIIYVRYHLAVLNLAQMTTNLKTGWKPPPDDSDCVIICDGVRLGFLRRLCRIERPYEVPHDVHEASDKGLSELALGTRIQDGVMIPQENIRLILGKLSARAGRGQISHQMKLSLMSYLGDEKTCLLPYVKLESVPAGERVLTGNKHATGHSDESNEDCSEAEIVDDMDDDSGDTYRLALGNDPCLSLIYHWSTPAPEIVFLPPRLLPSILHVIQNRSITVTQRNLIDTFSPGLHQLLKHEQCWSDGADETGILSDSALALLQESLKCVQKSLKSSTLDIQTRPYADVVDMSPVEKMLRTGVWAPHNDVIRTLPSFQRDRVNSLAMTRRHDKRASETAQALAELRTESRRRGVSCNKYKDRRGALTSGLFT